MATLAAAAAAASPAAAQSGGAWGCEASALRGTVLGTSIEPVVANVGAGVCRTARQALADTAPLPAPLTATAVSAATFLSGDDALRSRDRGTMAVAGVAGLRLGALTTLPIALPIEPLLVNVPTVTVPLLGISIDLEPVVRALLVDSLLSKADVLSLDAVTAYASGACVDGSPRLFGSSSVAGLRVLGLELPVDRAVTQALNLLNTASIDPSTLSLEAILTPLGLDLGIVGPLLQPVLDLLPPISIPAALAQVAVTPAEQTRDGDRSLTQRALRVQASLLGRPLLDLVVGEAAVGQSAVDCSADAAPHPTANDLALGCTTRKLTLIDVVPDGRRVRLLGAADRSLAGEEVDIVFEGSNDVVATPTVRPDGSFSATAAMPARRLRSTNKARYVARVGRQRSLNLKLQRRMRVTGIRTQDGEVTIAGRVTGPLARRAADREVVVTRRLTCKRYEVVGRGKPRRDGTFRIRVKAPEDAGAAVYRLRSKVQKTKRNRKLYPTFTLPRAVDLL